MILSTPKMKSYLVKKIKSLLLFGLVSILLPLGLFAQATGDYFPPKPEPAVYVHDYSGWLDGIQKQSLEQKLRAMNDTTSTQIILMIRPDIGMYDRAQYAFELGQRWGVGKQGKNNGVVMLIVTDGSQRGVFIAPGYGLEGALPDVVASRIARNVMIPDFRDGNYYQGINAGIDAVVAAVHGEYTDDSAEMGNTASLLMLLIIFTIILLIFFFLSRRRGRIHTSEDSYDDPDWPFNQGQPRGRRTIYWGGGGWGSGGWGGGSSGGGGWSGGSFGGGSFGGGGGGGSW